MIDRDPQEDLPKLAKAFFENLYYEPECEYGSVGLNCKRPFGNSDVEGDILEIIGAVMEGNDGEDECWSRHQRQYAAQLYKEHLVPYLQSKWK